MGVMRMGYVHVRVTDLAEAKEHYANTMGLYETHAEGNKVYYKGWDEWDHHSVVLEEGGVGLVKFGFKVENSERHRRHREARPQAFGVTVERMSNGREPRGRRRRPAHHSRPSHVIELYHDADLRRHRGRHPQPRGLPAAPRRRRRARRSTTR